MPAQVRAQRTVDKAIKRAPATITKQHRGQTPRTPRQSFKAYTVSELLQKHRDPRDVLLEIAAMDTEELARKAGCSYIEALSERRLAAQIVLPYTHSKMPVSVDLKHTRSIALNIVDEARYQELIEVAASQDAESDGSFSMKLIDSAPVEHTTTAQPIDPDSDKTSQPDSRKIEPTDTHKDALPTSLPPVSKFWNQTNRTTPLNPKPAAQGDKTGVSPSAAAAPSRAAEESWQKDEQHGTWAPDRRK